MVPKVQLIGFGLGQARNKLVSTQENRIWPCHHDFCGFRVEMFEILSMSSSEKRLKCSEYPKSDWGFTQFVKSLSKWLFMRGLKAVNNKTALEYEAICAVLGKIDRTGV